MPPKVSIIIPAKNEQEAIAKVVLDCKEALPGTATELIVVDASSDNTAKEAILAGAKVVRQIGNGGVGEALTQGFYWATGEYIVFLDADGTYDPADLHKIVEPLLADQADLVNGNRFADIEKGAMPVTNRIGNWMLTWIGNLMFRTSIKDSQSGMKGFRRDILGRIALLERGFPICSELLAETARLNLRVVEVGISYRRRIGKTKLRPATTGPKILWTILLMLRDYDPLFLFTMLGIALEIVALFFAWPVITEYVSQGTFRLIGRTLAAGFIALTGILSIFTGIILDAVTYSLRRIEGHAAERS